MWVFPPCYLSKIALWEIFLFLGWKSFVKYEHEEGSMRFPGEYWLRGLAAAVGRSPGRTRWLRRQWAGDDAAAESARAPCWSGSSQPDYSVFTWICGNSPCSIATANGTRGCCSIGISGCLPSKVDTCSDWSGGVGGSACLDFVFGLRRTFLALVTWKVMTISTRLHSADLVLLHSSRTLTKHSSALVLH